MKDQIELIPFLKRVLERTTTHYQEDFQIDQRRLGEAVSEYEPEERTFYWMARPTGTQLVLERNTFLRGSIDHSIWTHYADMSEGIRAYRVLVNGGTREAPLGMVCKLNYPEQVKRVIANAVLTVRIEISYLAGGVHEIPMENNMRERERLFYEYGMYHRLRYCPADEQELQRVLRAERQQQRKKPSRASKPKYKAHEPGR